MRSSDCRAVVSVCCVQTVSKGAFHRDLTELRRKIKTTQDETQEYDEEISRMKRQQQELTMLLDERQVLDLG